MQRLISAFSQLSPGLRIGVFAGAGLCVILGIVVLYPRLWWVMVLGVLLVALLLVLYQAVLRWRQKQKAEPFEKEVVANTGSTPHDISDVNQRARLDEMRRAFEQGVATFRAAGKDLYSLPWYLVAGEPGSGKTEVIRRSNVPFPPGLQDTLQGTGGTINMNWWFTNHAVILDTAGRLMFEQVPPGSSSEWNEFLRLLRRTRANCPINGMMLVIPADSLINDPAQEIQKKADQIALQLANIQRSLEVRFPVFIVVTKCDLVAGFREFFDSIDDIDLQHQIFGWSNPGPLDEPFDVEKIDEHIQTVRQRLEQRRMSLLLDPVSTAGDEEHEARRIDQVDSLYDFTDSFQRLAPSLKQYLGSVFSGGEWSGKPLFLRGIYFTSSLREGKALDSILAEAMGVSPEELPEDRPWERDRAYFLRDLFLNKVFKESRLVTRAGNTRRLRQQRQAALLGGGSVAVLALLVLTWFSFGAFQDRVGGQSETWARLAQAVPELPPVVGERRAGTGVYAYRGAEPALEHEGQTITLARLPELTLSLAEADIRVPAVFRLFAGLDRDLLHSRRFRAHDAIVRRLVLEPAVTGAAQRLGGLDAEDWSEQATAALAQIVRLHTFARGEVPAVDQEQGAGPLASLPALLRFLLEPEEYERFADDADAERLLAILARSHGEAAHAAQRQRSAAAILAEAQVDRLLADAVTVFSAYQAQAGAAPTSLLNDLEALRDAMVAFADAEAVLGELDGRFGDDRPAQAAQTWQRRFAELARAGEAMNAAVAALQGQGFDPYQGAGELLAEAEAEVPARVDRQFDALLRQLPADAADEADGAADDLRSRLQANRDTTRRNAEQRLAALVEGIEAHHADLMRHSRAMRREEVGPAYALRLAMYRQADDAMYGEEAPTVTLEAFAALVEAHAGRVAAGRQLVAEHRLIGDDTATDDAAELAEWALTLADRMNRWHLLDGVLDALPGDADALAAAVAGWVDAEADADWRPPRIPLAARFAEGGSFPAAVHPAGFDRFGPAWASLAERLDADAAARLPDMADLHERARDAERRIVGPYVQRYIDYWSEGIFADAGPGDFASWVQLRDALASLRPELVQPELARLAGDTRRALRRVPARFLAEPEREALIDLVAAQLTHDQSGFDAICNDLLRAWVNLTPRTRAGEVDVEAGIAQLVRLTPSDFQRDYLGGVVYTADPTEAPLRYWRDLALAALRTLADEGEQLADAAKQRLREEHRGFPLYRMPDAEPLTLEQVRRAAADAAHLRAVVGTLDDAEPTRLGTGARTGLPSVDHQLDRMAGAEIIEPAERPWLRSLTSIALALAGEGEPLEAELFLLPTGRQFEAPAWRHEAEPAIRPFRYVEIGGALRSTERAEADERRTHAVALPQDESFVIRFYRLDDDAVPAAEVELAAPFGLLAPALDEAVVYEDGTWMAPLRVRPLDEDDDQLYFYWVGLRFNRPLPSPEQWPAP